MWSIKLWMYDARCTNCPGTNALHKFLEEELSDIDPDFQFQKITSFLCKMNSGISLKITSSLCKMKLKVTIAIKNTAHNTHLYIYWWWWKYSTQFSLFHLWWLQPQYKFCIEFTNNPCWLPFRKPSNCGKKVRMNLDSSTVSSPDLFRWWF